MNVREGEIAWFAATPWSDVIWIIDYRGAIGATRNRRFIWTRSTRSSASCNMLSMNKAVVPKKVKKRKKKNKRKSEKGAVGRTNRSYNVCIPLPFIDDSFRSFFFLATFSSEFRFFLVILKSHALSCPIPRCSLKAFVLALRSRVKGDKHRRWLDQGRPMSELDGFSVLSFRFRVEEWAASCGAACDICLFIKRFYPGG